MGVYIKTVWHSYCHIFQGGDEVIACSKKDLLSNDLQAGTYKNPIGYQRPQRNDGEEIVSLVKVIRAATLDFQQCGILTRIDSE